MSCPDIQLEFHPEDVAPDTAPVLGQRATRQRRLIYDILKACDDHVDVETLYRKARDIDARVSLSTVYRTISLLKESGLVDEFAFDDDRRCYEFKKQAGHHHIRCMSCGEIIEFESTCTSKLRQKIEDTLEYQVDTVRIDIAGYCEKCRRH